MAGYKTRLLLLPFLLILCSILIFLFKSKISTDIKVLLPRDKWIENHLDYLRNSQLGSVIAVSLAAEQPENAKKLADFAKKLTPKISRIPGVTGVFAEVEAKQSIKIAGILFKHIPQILEDNYLNKIVEKKITVEGLKPILRGHYETILRPGGLFTQKMIAADPLNLHQILLHRLQDLGRNSGFKFKIKDSCLWSEDSKHLLMLVYTDIPVTNPEEAEKLHLALQNEIASVLPEKGFSKLIISGHRHAIDNRKQLQRDIFITLTVAGIGFFLLFALFFRDWRAFFVFIIPLVGMICALGLTLTFFKEPSAIILGLGATVIGIALDYGIHVFVASKNIDKARTKALKDVRKPLIFSALTTLGVFWAFFFSGTPGYRQLAFASTCGVALSLIFSLYCLPSLLPPTKTKLVSVSFFKFPEYNRPKAFRIVVIWFILAGLAAAAIHLTGFEADIRKLDGIGRELRQDEEKFHQTWGKNSQAAVSVTAENLEAALRIHDNLARYAKNDNIQGYQSLSFVWPSKSVRQRKAFLWDTFWSGDNEQKFKENLAIAGEKYKFSETAFKPFFDNLYKHNFEENLLQNPDFAMISKKFINYEKDKVRVSAFFEDHPNTVERMEAITNDIPNVEIISPASFGTYISTQIIKDATQIAVIALALVVILAFICLRSLSKMVVAMLPVFSAIVLVLPVFALFGMKINAVALVACIVVTGLAIDYGIFAVSACSRGEKIFSKDAFSALTLSALSTAIGAAALLFAGHPALRSVGLVISAGVMAGYFAAILISPALYKLICEKPCQKE